MEYLAATKFKMHPEKYKYYSVFNSIKVIKIFYFQCVLNYNSCEIILARDLVTGFCVCMPVILALMWGFGGFIIRICFRKLKYLRVVDRVLEYLGFGRAKFCFEVELLFLVETFQDSVRLLAFLLFDMKWVSWVTSSYLSVSIWVSGFVGCSLALTCSHERVFCFVDPLSRNLNPKA